MCPILKSFFKIWATENLYQLKFKTFNNKTYQIQFINKWFKTKRKKEVLVIMHQLQMGQTIFRGTEHKKEKQHKVQGLIL